VAPSDDHDGVRREAQLARDLAVGQASLEHGEHAIGVFVGGPLADWSAEGHAAGPGNCVRNLNDGDELRVLPVVNLPSMDTRVMMSSDRPEMPIGTLALSIGSPISGIAQYPAPIGTACCQARTIVAFVDLWLLAWTLLGFGYELSLLV
jgi:hypothetical protein